MQRHTDKSYERTIALLRDDGDDYAAILTERLWQAQKEIEKLEQATQEEEQDRQLNKNCGQARLRERSISRTTIRPR